MKTPRIIDKSIDLLAACFYLAVITSQVLPSRSPVADQLDEFPERLHASIGKGYAERSELYSAESKYYADEARRSSRYAFGMMLIVVFFTVLGIILDYLS